MLRRWEPIEAESHGQAKPHSWPFTSLRRPNSDPFNPNLHIHFNISFRFFLGILQNLRFAWVKFVESTRQAHIEVPQTAGSQLIQLRVKRWVAKSMLQVQDTVLFWFCDNSHWYQLSTSRDLYLALYASNCCCKLLPYSAVSRLHNFWKVKHEWTPCLIHSKIWWKTIGCLSTSVIIPTSPS